MNGDNILFIIITNVISCILGLIVGYFLGKKEEE